MTALTGTTTRRYHDHLVHQPAIRQVCTWLLGAVFMTTWYFARESIWQLWEHNMLCWWLLTVGSDKIIWVFMSDNRSSHHQWLRFHINHLAVCMTIACIFRHIYWLFQSLYMGANPRRMKGPRHIGEASLGNTREKAIKDISLAIINNQIDFIRLWLFGDSNIYHQ